jgi:hypothetical protein
MRISARKNLALLTGLTTNGRNAQHNDLGIDHNLPIVNYHCISAQTPSPWVAFGINPSRDWIGSLGQTSGHELSRKLAR